MKRTAYIEYDGPGRHGDGPRTRRLERRAMYEAPISVGVDIPYHPTNRLELTVYRDGRYELRARRSGDSLRHGHTILSEGNVNE